MLHWAHPDAEEATVFDPHTPDFDAPDPNTPDPNTPDLVTPETGEPDPVLAWTAMRDWLADSVAGIPAGGVLDLGPAEYDDSDDAGDVPCAQILVLRDQTFMVRLSTTVMTIPAVTGYAVPRAMLDRWNYEDRFRDCTHGYLLTRSRGCVADVCVAWFRDRRAISGPAVLGCHYTTGDPDPRARAAGRGSDGGDP
ncbi:MAG TPA: hypothetical protein DIW80_11415 [Gordonia polyisoprenivorans]|nr:hypothetical protein CJJ17_08150 [Gordonia polyisoprenivorans]QUD84175.1 hypothetical protein J8M97_06010 [Gordonia polyisoprenivorans]HCS57741.1 hypothetical protein [Gordonia polyisoprenivorans]